MRISKIYSFSNFQICSTVLLTIVSMLCMASSWLICVITTSIYLLVIFSHFASTRPLTPDSGNHYLSLYVWGEFVCLFVLLFVLLSFKQFIILSKRIYKYNLQNNNKILCLRICYISGKHACFILLFRKKEFWSKEHKYGVLLSFI